MEPIPYEDPGVGNRPVGALALAATAVTSCCHVDRIPLIAYVVG